MASLQLVAPRYVVAGDELAIAVELDCDEPLHTTGLGMQIVGSDGLRRGPRVVGTYLDEHVVLGPPTTLPAGHHTFVARVTIPGTAPPSHDTPPTFATLIATVVVVRPSPERDLAETATIRVYPRPRPLVVAPATTSSAAGAHADGMVLSVASSSIAVGQRIVGTVAMTLARKAVIEISLIAETRIVGVDGPTELVTTIVRRQSLPIARGTTSPVPFELVVGDVVPSHATTTYQRRWWLSAEVEVGFLDWLTAVSPDVTPVRLPIDIVAVTPDDEPVVRPTTIPRTGDPAIEAAFTSFATAEDWSASSIGTVWPFGVVGPVMSTTSTDGVQLVLAYASSAPAGRSMVAVARFPRLGLHLDVHPSTPFRELFVEDITAGHARWDRHHRVTARQGEQAAAFLRAVVPTLVELHGLGDLVRWTDTTIVFARISDEPSLPVAATELARVVEAIAVAAKEIRPPPIELDLDSWRAFADEIHGHVAPGSLDIDTARVGRTPVAIFVEWEYRPVTISVRVGPIPDAPLAAAAVCDHEHEAPAVIAELVAAMPAGVSDLRIADGTARARRALHRADDARQLVTYLHHLLASFDTHGIYR